MKKLLSLFLVLTLLFALAIPGFAASVSLSTQNLSVDGKAIDCEKYNIDGYNYFKLRDLAYVLNGTESQFEVGYDDATRTVTVSTGAAYTANGSELVKGTDKSATAVVSTQTIIIDHISVSDLSVYNIGGNNYFMLRDLAPYIGFAVGYDETTRTAVVTSAQQKVALTAEQIYATCTPAVFYMEMYDADGWAAKTGSGFFLTSDGMAVTNYHVISGAASAKITVSDTGEVYDVLGVYNYSVEEDWAILQIGGSGFRTLKVGDQRTAVGGATVYAIGSPLGLQNTLSQGLISNPARADGDMTYIQTTAAISPGSSGGALINKYGEVIGVTSATYSDGQNLNLAIPMTYLRYTDADKLTPLSEAANIASGSLHLDEYSVIMDIAASYSYISAFADWEGDEDVYLEYWIEDSSIVECEWGDWRDGDCIDLYFYPAGVGTTDVSVWLYTISGVLLDSKTVTVTVTASAAVDGLSGKVTLDEYNVAFSMFQSYYVTVCAVPQNWDEDYTVSYYIGDTSVVSCRWGDWYDTYYTNLLLYPVGPGTTEVTIVYHTLSGIELDTATLTVTVYGYSSGDSAYDSLGVWVLQNSNTDFGGDPAYVVTYEEYGYEFHEYMIYSAESGDLSLCVVMIGEGLPMYLFMDLDRYGTQQQANFFIYESLTAQTWLFAGYSYVGRDFNYSSDSFNFLDYSGDGTMKEDARAIAQYMVWDGLAFTDSLFSDFVPGGYSIADLGYVNIY